MKKYTEGYELKENEYLLKIRRESHEGINESHEDYKLPTGFITKFNKNGSIPVNFNNWGERRFYNTRNMTEIPEILIHTEDYSSGWKINGYRPGKSQNWCKLIHPNGFTLEIYLSNFFELINNVNIVNGEFIGEFKWDNNKLIKKQ